MFIDGEVSDDQEEKAPQKVDKEPRKYSNEPKQVQEVPKPPVPVIMSLAMNIDIGWYMGIMEPKATSILEKIRLKVVQRNFGNDNMAATFRVGWNPKDFMRRQFGKSYLASIGSVIVLNGTSLNAQATTCKEYLQEHWPTTSPGLLKCIEDSMNERKNTTKGTCPSPVYA
jgi:hypothetical protein